MLIMVVVSLRAVRYATETEAGRIRRCEIIFMIIIIIIISSSSMDY